MDGNVMHFAKRFQQLFVDSNKGQRGTQPHCPLDQERLLVPGIEPHPHQQAALDVGQVLLLQILQDLRAFGAGLDHNAAEGLFALLQQLDPLGRVDAQVDDVQITGDLVEGGKFLADAVHGVALFQQSLLDFIGIFFGPLFYTSSLGGRFYPS